MITTINQYSIVRVNDKEQKIARAVGFVSYPENGASTHRVRFADGIEADVPADSLEPASKLECLKYLRESQISTDGSALSLQDVGCNSAWDNFPSLALFKPAELEALLKPAVGLMAEQQHGISIESIVIVNEVEILFVLESEYSLDCLDDDNADDHDIEKLQNLIIIDGNVYEFSNDPSDFSESTWVDDGINVNAYGYCTVNYYSKHGDEKLWFTHQYAPEDSATRAA